MISLMSCAQTLPYQNDKLSAEERAIDLVSRLTIEEKASLMMHQSPAIPRLGIPEFNWWNESLHGVARNGTATVFPITMAMASTFDDALVLKAFTAASDEGRAKNNIARKSGRIKGYQCISFWTPNINIFRDPRWGRGQETYGEDPYLTAEMGKAVVRGLQGAYGNENIDYGRNGNYRKALACAKHFAVHSGPEWNRHSYDAQLVPERDLWETYLPAFKSLIHEADVQEIMCAYNSIDGEPCCGNTRFLKEILRDEWKFKGLVTSDCWAIDDFWKPGHHEFSKTMQEGIARAVNTGTDLECGGTYKNLTEAINAGATTEEKINTSLIRLMKARFELGDFDDESLVEWKRMGPEHIASPEHHDIALQLARKSIVLLQNNDNILPLKRSTRIAVIGPNANDSIMMWGNYNGFPKHTTTILDGLKQKGNVVSYLKGCELVQRPAQTDDDTKKPTQDYGHDAALRNNRRGEGEDASNTTPEQILAAVKDAEVVVFVGGISPRVEGEEMRVKLPGFKGGDRESIELPQTQRDAIKLIHDAGKPIVYINCSGSAVALVPETQNCKAILQAWYGGEAGGEALADILYGDYNPSGKLPITFYKSTDQLPDFEDYNMKGRTYRYMTEEPLWAFGYGLNYSSVSYGKPQYKGGTVSVKLTNRSSIPSTEVVQVYIRRSDDPDGPTKTLRAYQTIEVPASGSTTAKIPLAESAFEWWDKETNTVHPLAGKYDIFVGSSSRDCDLQKMQVSINVK